MEVPSHCGRSTLPRFSIQTGSRFNGWLNTPGEHQHEAQRDFPFTISFGCRKVSSYLYHLPGSCSEVYRREDLSYHYQAKQGQRQTIAPVPGLVPNFVSSESTLNATHLKAFPCRPLPRLERPAPIMSLSSQLWEKISLHLNEKRFQ